MLTERCAIITFVLLLTATVTSASASEIDEVLEWAKDKRASNFLDLKLSPVVQDHDAELLPKEYRHSPCSSASVRRMKKILSRFQQFSIDRLRLVCYRSNVPEALMGNNTLLLLSDETLKVWSDKEILAAVAHEVFHGTFLLEFRKLRLDEDFVGLRRVELKCDALAVILLREAGIDPKHLTAVLKKQEAFMKRSDVSPITFANSHPEFSLRYQLIAKIAEIRKH